MPFISIMFSELLKGVAKIRVPQHKAPKAEVSKGRAIKTAAASESFFLGSRAGMKGLASFL